MRDNMAKILVVVEGERAEPMLMRRLLKVYGIRERHEIVSYKTDIYGLYNSMSEGGDLQDMDLLQVLKERERDEEKKRLFDENYSDVILIFDFDPQAPGYSESKIMKMAEYFTESSDMGKLYINYPSVEAFYHMSSIPDEGFAEREVTLDELIEHKYKARVSKESKNSDYRKFATKKKEYNEVINANIQKAKNITALSRYPQGAEILRAQLDKLKAERCFYVLCTCIFYIYDYNPALLQGGEKEE